MKGIVLAGGSGTRLYPITKGVSKQLLSIYDKPMVYYPISVLMLAGIKEILIISTPHDLSSFKKLLGDGSELGLKFYYELQKEPNGLAEAFIIGKKFIGNDDVALILGDNLFYGKGFRSILKKSVHEVTVNKKAVVFGYYVDDPERYGVVSFDSNGNVTQIIEKPQKTDSNYAVVGLYFYPNNVIKKAKEVIPSERGELEITSLNMNYLNEKKIKVEILGRGFAWMDTGTHDSLLEASNFIHNVEKMQGFKIACLEEIAYKMGFIDSNQLISLIKPLEKSNYGKYLKNKVL